VICTPGVHDALVDALIAQAVRYRPGDGLVPDTLMGPVVNAAQLGTNLDWIARGAAEGGTPVTPATEAEDQFLAPTVFTGIKPTHRIAQEEVFGPVLAVMSADDADHAIDIPFGLSAGVVTNDMRLANHFIDRIQAGIVKVNRPTSGVDPNMPFGGVKGSSTNTFREQGSAATDFYTWTKSVYLGMDN
jgi:aldehyde dehydrogenase (NAD+)